MLIKRFFTLRFPKWVPASYVQGQSPGPKQREYFYYIDHEGMLFLDDARIKNFTSCFKEKAFLQFFFKRLKLNDTDRYRDDFPFLSICGRERNYIRCDDLPIVFTHIVSNTDDGSARLAYAHAGDLLTVPWEPQRICMFPATGRVYHPAPERYGAVGLVRSKLAIELSAGFSFRNGDESPPTHFTWEGTEYELEQSWWEDTVIGRR